MTKPTITCPVIFSSLNCNPATSILLAFVLAALCTCGPWGCADIVTDDTNAERALQVNEPEPGSYEYKAYAWARPQACGSLAITDGAFTGFDDVHSWSRCLRDSCAIAEPCTGKACALHEDCIRAHCPAEQLMGPGEHEWSCHVPVVGQFGIFYMHYSNGVLRVLNDWLMRDDQPICAGMFNKFEMSTGNGRQHWEIRVFGDSTIQVLLNGLPYEVANGGYHYGPSPNEAKPHAMFEFRLGVMGNTTTTSVQEGVYKMVGHDPASATLIGTKTVTTVEAAGVEVEASTVVAGCDDPEAANITEPTVFSGVLGSAMHGQSTDPVQLVMLSPGYAAPKMNVRVVARSPEAPVVTIGGMEAQVLHWDADGFDFIVPASATGVVAVRAHVAGVTSNPLYLTVLTQGTPAVCTNGSPCDDGLACTQGDVCNNGKCVGHAVCPAPPGAAPECVMGACDETGACAWQPEEGTCDDGNVCTVFDACAFGDCVGAPLAPGSCDDGKPCTLDSCHALLGCKNDAAVMAGVACADDDLCQVEQTCDGLGACGGGEPLACLDDLECTVDLCDPAMGCWFKPIEFCNE